VADGIGELVFLAFIKLSSIRGIGLQRGFKPIFDDVVFFILDKPF
jgi:hypothetical protein